MSKSISFKQWLGLEVFRQYRKNNQKLHKLHTLFWECTLRCNLSCQHCGSDCHVEARQPDMPIADFIRVADEVASRMNPNEIMVVFTGGECLLRKDLEVCGRALYDRGFPWGIVTNGLLLTEKRLQSLLEAGMHTLAISLDGFEESHNWLRGRPNSFQKASEAIGLLSKEQELEWDVVTCANRRNIGQLAEFRDFLIEKGVKSWRIFTIFPVGRATENRDLQLNSPQFTELMEFISDTRKEGKIHVSYGCEGFLGGYEGRVRDNLYSCQAGIGIASVLADGAISACPSIRSGFHQGSIYRDSFCDVWEKGYEKFRNRSWSKKGHCADCELFRYCEGNGMHLYDENENLLFCHHKRITTTP